MKETNADRHLRELLETVASKHPGVEVRIEPLPEGVDVARGDALQRLVASRRALQILHPKGLIFVAIDGGDRDVILEPIELFEERYVELLIVLREGIPLTETSIATYGEWVDRHNGTTYPSLAFSSKTGAITLQSAIPEVGLTSDALFSAINVMGRAARRHHATLEKAGLGTAPISYLARKGWKDMTNAHQT